MTDNDRKALEKLFELEKIEQIICVDDQYRDFHEDAINDVIGYIASDGEIQTKITRNVRELGDLIWEDDTQWKSQLKKIWSDADKVKRKNLYEQLIQLIPEFPNHDNQKKDAEYSGALKELLKPLQTIELKELSYSQWTKDYGRSGESLTDDELKKKGTLFLFDQDFSNESEIGGTIDGGINIIKNLLARDSDIPIMCGLLSHTFDPGDEINKWKEFAREYGIDNDRFVLISKQNLTEDIPGFIWRLRLPILSKYCNVLKEQASDILNKSFKESNKEINELNVYDFEKIVFHSSSAEGIWETDTLFRLYNIYHKHSIYQNILETQGIFETTNKLREISKIEMGRSNGNHSKLWKIQRLEYYEDGKQINKLHRPIELGDIFANTEGKKFILLAQPCNLMVRTSNPKGNRANDFHEVILAEIKLPEKKENSSLYSELLYFDENTGESWYIDFRKTHSVLLCILDLCVFNPEGDARISSDENCPPAVLPAWNYRFNILKKKFEAIIAEYSKYSDKKYEEDFLKKYLLPKCPAYGKALFTPKLQIDRENEKSTIKYNCKRVERLCKQHAEAILLKYSHYISRSAFDHDFGK